MLLPVGCPLLLTVEINNLVSVFAQIKMTIFSNLSFFFYHFPSAPPPPLLLSTRTFRVRHQWRSTWDGRFNLQQDTGEFFPPLENAFITVALFPSSFLMQNLDYCIGKAWWQNLNRQISGLVWGGLWLNVKNSKCLHLQNKLWCKKHWTRMTAVCAGCGIPVLQ